MTGPRLGRAADRALGEEVVYRIVRRVLGMIIGIIKRPITVAVIGEVADVLQKGHYTRNISRALEANRQTLTNTILEKVAADSRTGYLSRLPFYRDVAQVSADTSLSVVLEILNDPRTDALVADILRENLDQIRDAIHERDVQEGSGHQRQAPNQTYRLRSTASRQKQPRWSRQQTGASARVAPSPRVAACTICRCALRTSSK